MLCKEIMHRPVRWVSEDDSIANAARVMRTENIGFLPVTDVSGRFIGTLTDRDLAIRAVAGEMAPGTHVALAMTHETVCCSANDDVLRAEELMRSRSKSRMVCTDAEGHIEGIISIVDLAAYEIGGQAAETFKQISAREVKRALG
jgi:CBS domain-containing protein